MFAAWLDAFTGRWPMTVRWMLLSAAVAVATIGIPWLLLGYKMLSHASQGTDVTAVALTAIIGGALAGGFFTIAVVAIGCIFDARGSFDLIFIENTEDGPVLTGVRRNGNREHADLN